MRQQTHTQYFLLSNRAAEKAYPETYIRMEIERVNTYLRRWNLDSVHFYMRKMFRFQSLSKEKLSIWLTWALRFFNCILSEKNKYTVFRSHRWYTKKYHFSHILLWTRTMSPVSCHYENRSLLRNLYRFRNLYMLIIKVRNRPLEMFE